MADEYMEVCRRLWGSWEPGAIIADRHSGFLIDHTKVHAVNFEGRFYKTRGPLNSGPCPQGQPVIAQAGGSPRGRQFAAQYADTIVAHTKGTAGMKAYRDDVRARMVSCGRNPDSCKVLFLVAPIIGETAADTQEKLRLREARAQAQIPQRLAHLGKVTNIDFGRFDLDKPLPDDVTTNGHQQTLDEFRHKYAGKTLREAMMEHNTTALSVELIGTPDTVAAQMREVMEEVSGDGFLFSLPNVTRRSLAEIEDGLVPALQDRGLVRSAYTHRQFRDNLLEF
jgi:alkanesulfonate monooxygenase SsuD/methylene tetrahydromethanopterin reductase-like flavin-dependent oxidoreductase (luciferase family)